MHREHVLPIKFCLLLSFFLLTGCMHQENKAPLDGKKLLESKCASCHNLDMPPVISKEELAPPMMAVSFHVHRFVEVQDESRRTAEAIEFVVDYVLNPSLEKSFCDAESIKRYGLMPSQKESVTPLEIRAIAEYMFSHYTQKNLTKIQKLQNEYNAYAPGKKLALRYKCLGCHRVDKQLVGPSFMEIAKRYKNDKKSIEHSIQNGSQKKWEGSRAMMPAFKEIKDEDLEILSKWILDSNLKN